MPLIGFYSATKAAVEALHETMAQEVKAFGIKVTLIEPGAYATDFGKSAIRADGMEAYEGFRKQILANLVNLERGDPQATPDAILKVVDAENPPLRLAVGSTVLPTARTVYADRIATWEAWEDVSNAAQGDFRASITEKTPSTASP
jgi:NAD(P)-dependent dehydrogenase (short-subunit alcohol dehydrogenase family)